MRQLTPDRVQNFLVRRTSASDVFIGFATMLAIADENDRRAEITSITHEAAGVANRTGCIGEHLEVIFWGEIDEGTKPVGFRPLSEHPNRFANVIGTGINVG